MFDVARSTVYRAIKRAGPAPAATRQDAVQPGAAPATQCRENHATPAASHILLSPAAAEPAPAAATRLGVTALRLAEGCDGPGQAADPGDEHQDLCGFPAVGAGAGGHLQRRGARQPTGHGRLGEPAPDLAGGAVMVPGGSGQRPTVVALESSPSMSRLAAAKTSAAAAAASPALAGSSRTPLLLCCRTCSAAAAAACVADRAARRRRR